MEPFNSALLNAPLTRADLDEWADRLGKPSPTPFDAIRFGTLQMRISAARDRAAANNAAAGVPMAFPSLGSIASFFKKGPDGNRGSGFPALVVSTFASLLLAAQDAPFGGGIALAPTLFSGTPVCCACGKAGGGLKACARCRGETYCGVECQKARWPEHRKSCRDVATGELPKGKKAGGQK